MLTTLFERLDRYGPNTIVVPFLAAIGSFYAMFFLPYGIVAGLGGALVGVLWALLLGTVAQRIARREEWRRQLANGSLLLGIACSGLLIGGGILPVMGMNAVLDEPSTTYAVLSALMSPAVPYYIVLNMTLELLLVGLIVSWNWETPRERKALLLIGVTAYFVMRIWTYLVFAENRLEITQRTLTDEDVAWYRQTLATDFRTLLNVILYFCWLAAAFVPALAPERVRKPATVKSGTPLLQPALE